MTVLSESTQYAPTRFGVVLLFFAAIAFIIAFVMLVTDETKIGITSLIICVVLIIVFVAFSRESYRRLKVTIPDDYPAVTLHDNYNVVDRDGDIWIIQEKEPIKEQKE